jgi:tetratricopeptide (TPR) repeat protein
LALAYTQEGKLWEAEHTYSEALTLIAKQKKPDAPALARVYVNLADLYSRQGKHKQARKMAEKAKGLRDQAAAS